MIFALLAIRLLGNEQVPGAEILKPPGVEHRINVSGATESPWITANGWRFQRTPGKTFIYAVRREVLPLAMAEAAAWSGDVYFRVDAKDLPVYQKTLALLKALDNSAPPPRVQIAVVDDGSAEAGEVLNLLARRNLLAKSVPREEPGYDLVVRLGSPEFPSGAARNPSQLAARVRQQLGDDKRLLRLYGSESVLGRLEGGGQHSRLHLLNYAPQDVRGLRVRVLGEFPSIRISALGQTAVTPQDAVVVKGATEFTIPKLDTYAVVDLGSAEKGVLTSRYSAAEFPPTADPEAPQWRTASPVTATRDFLGREVRLAPTEVRSRWTKDHLYLLFICPYDELNLKPAPDRTTETPVLWNWDVAEAFIGSDFEHITRYKEFQVSPQGEWIDLDIDRENPKPNGGASWNSGFSVEARIDHQKKIWYGEMKIPLTAIDSRPPRAGNEMRIGLYRIQGSGGAKHYIAWQPTGERSFHVPQAFGTLRLTD